MNACKRASLTDDLVEAGSDLLEVIPRITTAERDSLKETARVFDLHSIILAAQREAEKRMKERCLEAAECSRYPELQPEYIDVEELVKKNIRALPSEYEEPH